MWHGKAPKEIRPALRDAAKLRAIRAPQEADDSMGATALQEHYATMTKPVTAHVLARLMTLKELLLRRGAHYAKWTFHHCARRQRVRTP
ncbi:protein of unknown function (plasmid) [Cupriavidus taiwanensis]|uniref:Transposase n=1 Tax=Cupriavidus taiwanensis TaxID=164546 RepID=A0A375CKA2_9BURK|nr:hypothetical protein CBM2587_P20013 [Cupriavidus taiwanensis]SOZ18697.1 hypothetical protein CBM2597_U20107 [Cupriavidus taiwanensis]SOZ96841.1 hypothetical protein CBM2598_U20118 [Cupriavidus taiwanensis]SPC25991.1 hypothetical protein CBM2594_U30013 [Cupriavidus taiwanensis]SPD37982.1 protein of unknown function [Cupriavidus taiwanensis]